MIVISLLLHIYFFIIDLKNFKYKKIINRYTDILRYFFGKLKKVKNNLYKIKTNNIILLINISYILRLKLYKRCKFYKNIFSLFTILFCNV